MERQREYAPVPAADAAAVTAVTAADGARLPGQLWRQYFIAGLASFSIACAAYAMGWTSPVYVKLRDANLTDSPLPAPVTMTQEAWIGSMLTVGGTLGPFISGYAQSRIGRKGGILASISFLFLGWLLVAFATNVYYLYAARFFWGVCTGMLFGLTPMYCAEIATDDVRGGLGSFLELFSTVGFLLIYSIGPFVSYAWVANIGIAFAAFFVAAFFFMPESPIYHLTKNDREAAARCLMQIRGRTREAVEAELDKMEIDVSISMARTARYADIFKGANLRALYISCVVLAFQQASGITAVLFYMTTIFKAAGSNIDASLATIIIGSVQLSASVVTPFTADRAGRRTLLMLSCLGTATGLGLLGLYFFLERIESPMVEHIGFLPLLSLVLYITTFPMGLGAMAWTIVGEVFSIEVKSKATPLVTAFHWLLSIITTRFFGPLTASAGMHVTFWLFGISCFGGIFFTYFCVYETKGKSYLEIQDMMTGKVSARESAKKRVPESEYNSIPLAEKV